MKKKACEVIWCTAKIQSKITDYQVAWAKTKQSNILEKTNAKLNGNIASFTPHIGNIRANKGTENNFYLSKKLLYSAKSFNL